MLCSETKSTTANFSVAVTLLSDQGPLMAMILDRGMALSPVCDQKTFVKIDETPEGVQRTMEYHFN